MFYRIARAVVKAVISIIYRPLINNSHYLDNLDKGSILISNHAHMSDIIFLAISTKKTLHFIGKEELFENAFLNWLFSALGAFPIKRKSADIKAIRRCIELINKGEVIVIFPEGSRSASGEMTKFESGVSFIAMQCKSLVVPAYVRPEKYHTRAVIDFGMPIDLQAHTEGIPKNQRLEAADKLLYSSVAALRDSQRKRLDERK